MNLAEIKKKVEEIICGAEYTAYGFDGEDLYPAVQFDAGEIIREIVELIAEICPTLRAGDTATPTQAGKRGITK